MGTHWKKMIINFIERYFYLICFATYARQYGPEGFKKTFVEFMNENSSLRDLVQNGKEKLGEVVTKLYKISHTTYSDMPRGVIKDTLMRKLTCKTLMEILPGEVVGKIQKEMAEKKLSSDFETVVGLVVAA